ncbi:hypothetical protein ACQ27_gp451 [Klebsiella phage K64-1]|uniref:hypothetical protein n=1 Tax=Klebsiella phage K64-1 TaxID=1439894 RepID=UPI00248C002C|nr:hypothetical protein ACQ27_gp451 [Klebsiella phage K64-1]
MKDVTLPVVQTNFENQFLAEVFKIDNGVVSINYGFNSGGYEKFIYFVTADGGCLAIDTVLNEFSKVDFNDDNDPQWYIVGYDVNYEDEDLYDDHTNQKIESAWGDIEDDYQSVPEDFE